MPAIDLNDEYEIESKIPNMAEIMGRYTELSGAAARRPGAHLDVAYGDRPRQLLDVFAPADGGAPALMYFHGGYWRAGSKDDRRFPADAWNDRGIAWVPVEYRLAPEATLDEIVDDARSAVAWLYRNAAGLGCDPDRLIVSGNSAGGHLVGMLAAQDWQGAYGVPHDVVKAGSAISGLFDLEPLRHTFANEWLSLDAPDAERNSPLHHLPRHGLSLAIAWGGKESDAFKRQSEEYARACRSNGAIVKTLAREAADHFSIIGELGQSESPLFTAVAEQIAEV